jgi:hypothetical protein
VWYGVAWNVTGSLIFVPWWADLISEIAIAGG